MVPSLLLNWSPSIISIFFSTSCRVRRIGDNSGADLIMMDNYRLLHGRTAYETKEGERFLQGCYIDYDSTEGKLRHLKRKFNL